MLAQILTPSSHDDDADSGRPLRIPLIPAPPSAAAQPSRAITLTTLGDRARHNCMGTFQWPPSGPRPTEVTGDESGDEPLHSHRPAYYRRLHLEVRSTPPEPAAAAGNSARYIHDAVGSGSPQLYGESTVAAVPTTSHSSDYSVNIQTLHQSNLHFIQFRGSFAATCPRVNFFSM